MSVAKITSNSTITLGLMVSVVAALCGGAYHTGCRVTEFREQLESQSQRTQQYQAAHKDYQSANIEAMREITSEMKVMRNQVVDHETRIQIIERAR